jgi:hypothetical protein
MARRMMSVTSVALVLCWTLALALTAWPQDGGAHPAEGTYEVTATGNDIGTIKFSLVLKRNSEKWQGEIRDSPTPLVVTNVTVDGENNIVIAATLGETIVMITGKYDGGKISGNWKAGEATGNWSAARHSGETKVASAPAASSGAASSAAEAGLEGTYDLQVTADGQGTLPLVLIIKRDGGKLATAVENLGDINITGIEIKEETITLFASYQGNPPFPLTGKRSGTEMSGKWEAGGFTGTWSAKKRN